MSASPICPAYALAHVAPDFVSQLSDVERFVLPWMRELWLRPEQRLPTHDWRSCTFIAARGFGKTAAIRDDLNMKIESGRVRSPALMAPNLDRVEEVQINELIKGAPPWFRPERYNKTIRWPNGVIAEVFTPEAPGRPRSGNYDYAWLCEPVDYPVHTRANAFENLVIATRVRGAQYVIDTTSKGKANEIIQIQRELCAADPVQHVMINGTTFDNPMLSRKYIESACQTFSGQSALEELFGRVFTESAGALWTQETIDVNRRARAPERPELVIVAVDPALSARSDADEFGIVVGARGRDGHSYVLADHSGHYTPEEWGKIVVDRCALDASGVVIETNRSGGDAQTYVVTSHARARGMNTHVLDAHEPFPVRRQGTIFVRQVTAHTSKGERASGPATESAHGRVHVVGELPELERELTTYEPGGSRHSPNRFDAHTHLINELAGLGEKRRGQNTSDVKRAASAAEELRKRLARADASRRIGL